MSKLSEFVKSFAELGHRRVRKNPRIHLKAKSKRFIVKPAKVVDPIEYELITKWRADYNLQFAAAKKLFQYELQRQQSEEVAAIITDDASERVKRQIANDAWNKETRLQARGQLEKLLATLVNEQHERHTSFESAESARVKQLSEKLAVVSSLSGQFITANNLDAKLDEIMNSDVIDYNFLVDRRGNIIKGSRSITSDREQASPEERELTQTNHVSTVV